MKAQKYLSLFLIVLIAALAACGEAAEVAEVIDLSGDGETAVVTFSDSYDDALTIRNQLLLGVMRLEGTAQAITAEQAPELITLWQAFAALSDSGTAAPEETEAIQNQIMAALTAEQVNAIVAMQLTNVELQTFYVETGISEVKTPEPGVTPQSEGQGGGMSGLPQEDREATRAASGGEVGSGSGGGGKSDILLEMMLELLGSK